MLEHDWVNYRGAVFSPDTKSGARVRATGQPVLKVTKEKPQIPGNPSVFADTYGVSHYEQIPDLIVRLCYAAKIEDVTAHTFRHTFGSLAGDLGHSELMKAYALQSEMYPPRSPT